MSAREDLAVDSPVLGRNLRALAVARLAAKLGGLAAIVVLARVLAPDEFGAYIVAVSLVALISTLGDVGAGGFLVREGTRRPEDLGRLVGGLATLRVVLGGAALGISVGVGAATSTSVSWS
jgi:O-antigen/teichoic acid export membrane protein